MWNTLHEHLKLNRGPSSFRNFVCLHTTCPDAPPRLFCRSLSTLWATGLPDSSAQILEELESLSEGLAIGRLDGTVLLLVSLVTFLTTGLATWLPALIERTMGYPANLSSAFGFSIVFSLVLGLAFYAYAYVNDDLWMRETGFHFFAIGLWLFLTDIYLSTFTYVGTMAGRCLLGAEELFGGILFLTGMPACLVVAMSVMGFFNSSLTKWMSRNIPRRWRSEGRDINPWARYLNAHRGYVWVAGFGLTAQTGIAFSILTRGIVLARFESRELASLVSFIAVVSFLAYSTLRRA